MLFFGSDLNHDLNQWFKSTDLNETTLIYIYIYDEENIYIYIYIYIILYIYINIYIGTDRILLYFYLSSFCGAVL